MKKKNVVQLIISIFEEIDKILAKGENVFHK